MARKFTVSDLPDIWLQKLAHQLKQESELNTGPRSQTSLDILCKCSKETLIIFSHLAGSMHIRLAPFPQASKTQQQAARTALFRLLDATLQKNVNLDLTLCNTLKEPLPEKILPMIRKLACESMAIGVQSCKDLQIHKMTSLQSLTFKKCTMADDCDLVLARSVMPAGQQGDDGTCRRAEFCLFTDQFLDVNCALTDAHTLLQFIVSMYGQHSTGISYPMPCFLKQPRSSGLNKVDTQLKDILSPAALPQVTHIRVADHDLTAQEVDAVLRFPGLKSLHVRSGVCVGTSLEPREAWSLRDLDNLQIDRPLHDKLVWSLCSFRASKLTLHGSYSEAKDLPAVAARTNFPATVESETTLVKLLKAVPDVHFQTKTRNIYISHVRSKKLLLTLVNAIQGSGITLCLQNVPLDLLWHKRFILPTSVTAVKLLDAGSVVNMSPTNNCGVPPQEALQMLYTGLQHSLVKRNPHLTSLQFNGLKSQRSSWIRLISALRGNICIRPRLIFHQPTVYVWKDARNGVKCNMDCGRQDPELMQLAAEAHLTISEPQFAATDGTQYLGATRGGLIAYSAQVRVRSSNTATPSKQYNYMSTTSDGVLSL